MSNTEQIYKSEDKLIFTKFRLETSAVFKYHKCNTGKVQCYECNHKTVSIFSS